MIAAGIWNTTIKGAMPAINPITVALAPRLSAYKITGLSITIMQETKLKKKKKEVVDPFWKTGTRYLSTQAVF